MSGLLARAREMLLRVLGEVLGRNGEMLLRVFKKGFPSSEVIWGRDACG